MAASPRDRGTRPRDPRLDPAGSSSPHTGGICATREPHLAACTRREVGDVLVSTQQRLSMRYPAPDHVHTCSLSSGLDVKGLITSYKAQFNPARSTELCMLMWLCSLTHSVARCWLGWTVDTASHAASSGSGLELPLTGFACVSGSGSGLGWRAWLWPGLACVLPHVRAGVQCVPHRMRWHRGVCACARAVCAVCAVCAADPTFGSLISG